MRIFLEWINSNGEDLDPFVKAGRAHLWFEVLHPFEDGNGRIGRASRVEGRARKIAAKKK
jgi:Fic family protein